MDAVFEKKSIRAKVRGLTTTIVSGASMKSQWASVSLGDKEDRVFKDDDASRLLHRAA